MKSWFAFTLPLLLANILSGQTILFQENFDSCALTDQWNYTLEGNQNVAWGVGIPSNPKAEGLSMNGTCFLFIDDDLTGDKTPPFKLRVFSEYFNGNGYSDLTFQADVHFRRDKTEVMKIYIDNGQEEFLIRTFRNTNFSGSKFNEYIQMKSDISFYASDSMRIIIEYDDDNQWGWWAGIDNIVVTGAGQGDIVMGETFNGCSKPADWQTEIVNGIDDWQFGIFHDGKTMDGTCFTFFNDDILGKDRPLSKIRLYSPFFKGDEYGRYTLVYDLIFRTYEPSEYLQVYVDNGREWIPIKTYNGDVGGPNINEIVRETVDLSPYRNENIRLIWEYNDGGWAWWLGLDNIKIVGAGDINDKCAKAISLTPDQPCVPFDNTNALQTDELNINIPGTTGKVYFSWVPEESGTYLLTTSCQFNDIIEVFTGTCDSATALPSKNKDEFGFKGEQLFVNSQAGQPYIIRVSGLSNEFGLDRGQGCIQVKKQNDTANPPSNEICDQAIRLVDGEECISSVNTSALLDGPLPLKNHRSRADVWFSYTPTTTGDYYFESQADFADVITVFKGNCQNMTEWASDFSGHRIDLKSLQKDTMYFIQVTGYFSLLEGKMCGQIKKTLPDSVTNPVCQLALPLTLDGECQVLSNHGAGFSGKRPACDVSLADDVWYSFTAPVSGTVYWRAKADFRHIISLYSGQCTDLEPVTCLKNQHHCTGYQKTEALVPGQTYYIQVGSLLQNGAFRTGDICLEIFGTKPVSTPLSLVVEQECLSRGAVRFIPTASGGEQPYTFSGLGITEVVSGNDTYTIEVRDNEDCVEAKSVQARSCLDFGCSLVSDITAQHVKCHGGSDGAAIISATGGLQPFTYTWSNGALTETASGLEAGTYTVTLSDASGCLIENTVTIYQPAQLATNATLTIPTCYGENNGAIDILATGGSGVYTYEWSNGSTESDLSNIGSGMYTLTLTDDKGCSHVETLIVNEPEEITSDVNLQNNPCHGSLSGSIFLTGKGGTGSLSYLWSNGENGPQVIYLPAGEYTVTITDENLCSVIKSWTITQPDTLFAVTSIENLIITDTENARIQINVQGGTPPYHYFWFKNNEPISADTNLLIIPEIGNYRVVITDSNDCTWQSQEWVVTKTSSTGYLGSVRLHVKPNPVSRDLWIIADRTIELNKVQIRDSTGKTLWKNSGNIFHTSEPIDVSRIPSGTYFLSVTSGVNEISLPFVKIE